MTEEARAHFNINDVLLFRCTPDGEALLIEHAGVQATKMRALLDARVKVSAEDYMPLRHPDGRCRMPFWQFCAVFGTALYLGGPKLIENGAFEVIRR